MSAAEPTAPDALALSEWLPMASALVAIAKLPFAAASPVPTDVVPSKTVTVPPAGAPLPFTVGAAFVEGEAGVVPLRTMVDCTTYASADELTAPGAPAVNE